MTDPFDDEERRLLAGGATTLFERLEAPDAFVRGRLDDATVSELFDAWREQFPDEAAFERRLSRVGATRAECRRAIGAGRLADDRPIPDWVDRLGAFVAAVQARGFDAPGTTFGDAEASPDSADPADATDPADPTEQPPFGRVTAAMAAVARERLPDDPVREVLSDEAVDSAVRWFRRQLHASLVRVLFVECKSFVAAHDRDRAHADPSAFDDPPTEYFEAFVAYLADGGLADLCVEYPMAGRLLETQVRQFEASLRELCRRVRADRDAIADRFGDGSVADGTATTADSAATADRTADGDDASDATATGGDTTDSGGTDPGRVADLEILADDTHRGGRAVTSLTFESGLRVVYKPRSVEAGRTFYRVLGRLDEHLSVPDLFTPTYLSREEYGYMEYVEHAECPDRTAAKRYYRRAGALAAVAYFLEFVDCQYENLLVAGDQPVLVDAETVLHPYFETARRPVGESVDALRRDSVLLTALFPHTVADVYGSDGPDWNAAIAGFGVSSAPAEIEHVRVPRIEAANTDVMTVEEVPVEVDRAENVPTVDGADQPPAAYREDLVAGFEEAYETVLALRDDGRLAEVGLPDAFAGVTNRVVYRATLEYGTLVRRLCSRRALADGAAFDVEIESLAVPFCDGRVGEPRPWSLFEAERRTLRRLDPPRFESRTDGTGVRLPDADFEFVADDSGEERCRRRIAAADRADLRRQVELVRGSCGELPNPDAVGDDQPGPRPVTDDRLREEARALFEAVRVAGLRSDGVDHWATIKPWTVGNGEPITLLPAADSLYFGRSGVGLFAAALFRVTGEDRYRQFALDAVRPVRAALGAGTEPSGTAPEPAALKHLGGTVGVGSVAYGLAAVGTLLEADPVVADAAGVVAHLPGERVAADDDYDVVGGAAGTILGLLGVHDRHPSPELVDAAADCGDHLLAASRSVEAGRVWDTFDTDRPLTGFAHGTAGIAYALARLSDATGETKYRDAALEAVAYEAAEYVPEAGNWPDHRVDEWTDAFADQWCHGRSGIGLARVGMAEYVADDLVARGIDRAASTVEEDLVQLDHLCCGNAGRAAFLLAAERRRGRCTGQARELLGATLARKESTGAYQLHTFTEEVVDPSLFMGLSGIGYSMLRVTAPEELPEVLLWE